MALVLAGLAVLLAVANRDILLKQEIVREGRLILMPLAPRDPRSLIQGDYMALRYAENLSPPGPGAADMPFSGTAILKLDADGGASFARPDDGTPLGAHEVRLHYKSKRYGWLRYDAESFFFQEGDAKLYAAARYGVLRVDPSGASVLVGLADADRKLIRRR